MPEDDSSPQPKESLEAIAALYSAIQALTIHSQENKTTTLGNFLLFNSFLLVSWATMFSQLTQWTDAFASWLICGVGIMVAAAWRGLMKDYASASDLFRQHLERTEQFLPVHWQGPIADRKNQIEKRNAEAQKAGVGDRDLMTWVPSLFAAMYVALLLLSLAKLERWAWR
jgi:hypothetical protein